MQTASRYGFLSASRTRAFFLASADPLGANPFGGQLFAMRPDGLGLCQLTDASGFTTNPDGSIRVELPGPFAYSAVVR